MATFFGIVLTFMVGGMAGAAGVSLVYLTNAPIRRALNDMAKEKKTQ